MVLASPIRTVDTTSTSGVGTYTLADPASPGDGLRTLKDAVTMGHVSNGDTIEYNVCDKTKQGAAAEFEEGIGTVGSGGLTVTRDEIISNHNGDTNPVSWGAGGSRTFTVQLAASNVCRTANNLSDVLDADAAADNIGAARLNAAAMFTATPLQVLLGNTGTGVVSAGSIATTGVCGRFDAVGDDSTAAETIYSTVRTRITNSTDGAEASNLEFLTQVGGSLTTVFKSSGGVLVDSSSTPYDAFPSGFGMLADSVPTGWTRQNSTQSRLIRLAKSGDTLGATGGGADVFSSWSTDGHTLVISEIPSHTHPVEGVATGVDNGVDKNVMLDLSGGTSFGDTEATGGGGSHSHTMTTPYFRIMARITKD